MSLIPNPFGEDTDKRKQARLNNYPPLSIGPDGDVTRDALREEIADAGQNVEKVFHVTPYKKGGGLQKGQRLLESLHEVEYGGRKNNTNVSPAHAFELYYHEGRLDFRFVPGSERTAGKLRRQIMNNYPNAQVEEAPRSFMQVPDEDRHLAGATLELLQPDPHIPIKHYEIEPEDFEQDPYGAITSEMVNEFDHAKTDVLVQIILRPAKHNWTDGVVEKAKRLQEPTETFRWSSIPVNILMDAIGGEDIDYTTTEEPPQEVKNSASIIENQVNEKGYHLNINIFALSDDLDEASQRVRNVANEFETFYLSTFDQGFAPVAHTGEDLRELFTAAAGREWTDREMIQSTSALAGACHLLDDEINTPGVEFVTSRAGKGVPVGTPRFDYEQVGLDPMTATQREKEAAILRESGPDEPYWHGHGVRNGVEAGVWPQMFEGHTFLDGATRQGKTTFLKHHTNQVIQRSDEFMLAYDPKGQDGQDFAKAIPDEDEDDLIFIDIGNPDAEKQVTLNFLEPPSDIEPGTPAFDEWAQTIIEGTKALLAQSGGEADFWGARMDRITLTMVKAFADMDEPCTLIDLYYAVSFAREEVWERVQDQGIRWVEYAEKIAEMDDQDVDAISGRLQKWVQTRELRELTSAPESSINIFDAVREGKKIIVRDQSTNGEVGKLVSSMLLRLVFVAVQWLDRKDDTPEKTHVILDEFNDIIKGQSGITKILSNAAGFDMTIMAACQDLTSQVPQSIYQRVLGQCDFFVTFYPGRYSEAQAVATKQDDETDADDLMGLDKYEFYMWPRDAEMSRTHTVKCKGLYPIDENDHASDFVHSADEMTDLIERSKDRYGVQRRTDEEIVSDLTFHSGEFDDTVETEITSDLDVSEDTQRNQALKAVYDESIRQGDPGGWIEVADCVDRLNRYLPSVDVTDAGKAWRKVLQEVPDPYIDRREVDDEMEVKPLDTGFLNLGDSENDGKAEHWAPMADAYVPMTQLGFIFEIPEQTGDAMPDGLARLDDVLDINRGDDPDAIADAVNAYREDHPLLDRLAGTSDAYIESEHTTGSTQPSQTVKNLAQAHNAGHRCLFFAREDVAESVYETVADAPFCCRSSHPNDDERRFYTGTQTLTIDGETITRPGGRENIWVYDEQTGKYELRDGDGAVHARFNSAADIFNDASAYPSHGDRNVKPPIIPEYEMDGDLGEVEWDVIVVPPETETPMDLRLYEGDEQTPLTDLPTDDDQDDREGDDTDAADDRDGQDDGEDSTDEDDKEDDYLEDDLSGVFN